MSINNTEDLLTRYLAGEMTETEMNNFELWLNKDERNLKYFEMYKLIWDESINKMNSNLNETEAWERFKTYRENHDEKSDKARIFQFSQWPLFRRVAAAAVFIMLSGTVVYLILNKNFNHASQTISFYSGKQVRSDTLSDGTIAVLNKESSLIYASKFNDDTRPVTLQGEAFFEVAPDKKKPFLIYTDDETVKVVGTSFNVKRDKDKLEVIVKTGVVEVYNKKYNVKLLPGEMAIFSAASDEPVKQKITDELYDYYRTKKFVCNKTPLKRLVEILNEAYKSNIVIINPKLKDAELTTTFEDENLNDILKVIGKTFSIQIEKKQNQINLY